ncbi:hypothetical protein GCM10010129_79400 [Streptomyces fumigatiscleroticus]|nr:hypothetical protein GCM10010129_79400 [Streptomyces fumigatiscleroticus]
MTIEVSKAQFKVGMRAPGAHTGQVINASTRILGLAGSVVGPLMVLRISVDVPMPWQGIWTLALVTGGLPLLHILFGNRHDRR